MKLLIVGSRSILKFNLEKYVKPEVDTIISGGASGIDRLAEEYADQHKLSKYIIKPQYHKYRRAAPLKRNELMVDLADEVLVIWDGVSKGSKYTMEYANKKGKNVRVIFGKVP